MEDPLTSTNTSAMQTSTSQTAPAHRVEASDTNQTIIQGFTSLPISTISDEALDSSESWGTISLNYPGPGRH